MNLDAEIEVLANSLDDETTEQNMREVFARLLNSGKIRSMMHSAFEKLLTKIPGGIESVATPVLGGCFDDLLIIMSGMYLIGRKEAVSELMNVRED